ncbi:MAG: hypothetical protein WBA74_14985 [Cyclobacteriaceae bacterium]
MAQHQKALIIKDTLVSQWLPARCAKRTPKNMLAKVINNQGDYLQAHTLLFTIEDERERKICGELPEVDFDIYSVLICPFAHNGCFESQNIISEYGKNGNRFIVNVKGEFIDVCRATETYSPAFILVPKLPENTPVQFQFDGKVTADI